ncbi:MAG: hypothetical protein AAF958_12560 [Planctomycetota bacterium]
MKKTKLSDDEFAAIAIFLHAQKVPGLDLDLTRFNDAQIQKAQAKLKQAGHMVPGDRPGTWHLDEQLMLQVLTVVQPKHLVLVQDLVGKRSMQFSIDQKNITAVICIEGGFIVADVKNLSALSKHAIEFLDGSRKARVAFAKVDGNQLAKGSKVEVTNGVLEKVSADLESSGDNRLTPERLYKVVVKRLGGLGFEMKD